VPTSDIQKPQSGQEMLPPLVARKGDKRHTKCEYQNCVGMARRDLIRNGSGDLRGTPRAFLA